MLLPLVSPVGADFLKDFPAVNAVNCDLIDEYAGPCLVTHPLTAWTPQVTAVTTSPVLGTGAVTRGYYYRIFDQIFAWGEFRFGTAGINAGSGIYMISLPVPAQSPIGFWSTTIGEAPVVGNGVMWDDSAVTGRHPLTAHLRDSTHLVFGFRMDHGAPNREVDNNDPIIWAVNDGLTFSVRYTRAT